MVAKAIFAFPPESIVSRYVGTGGAVSADGNFVGRAVGGLLVEVLYQKLPSVEAPWSLGEELAWNLLLSELGHLFGYDHNGAEWWFQLIPDSEEVRVSALLHEHVEDVLAMDIHLSSSCDLGRGIGIWTLSLP